MSITTNRIALSSIKDTHLNSSSVSPSNTPTKDRKRPTLFNSIRKPTHGHSASVSRTDLFTKSFALANSATTLNKKFSPLRAVSFSDYRSTSNSNGATPGLRLQSTSDAFRNDTAGLAATKLKLKLQLAYYKVQQNKETRLKSMKYNTTSKSAYKSTAIKLNSVIASLESPPTSAKNSPTPTSASGPFDSPDYHSIIKPSAVLPTPPDQQKPTVMNYSHSINVNLNATPSHKSTFNAIINPTKSRLNRIATKKGTAKRSQKLKLFQIKKNSVYYNSNQKKLPLIQKQEQFGMDIVNHSTSFSAPSSQGNATANNAGNSQGVNFSFINYPQSQESTTGNSHLPSIILNPPTTTTNNNTSNSTSSYLKHHEQKTSLPSINKILKTPIKRANSMRPPSHFSFQTSFNDAAPLVVPGSQSQGNPNDETIIDEDNEMTIIQNTTINNTTIDQNATIEVNDDDDDDKTTNKKQQDILTSSPLHNQQFTTPNKFSVAKSLLQLGGHRM